MSLKFKDQSVTALGNHLRLFLALLGWDFPFASVLVQVKTDMLMFM